MSNYKLYITKFKEKFLDKDWLVNKFLPVFSAVFFLITKLFFNFLLWKDRILPPEPGDVFNYLRHIRMIAINYVKIIPTYTAYSVILGNIVKISPISIEDVFFYSFFIGFILLTIVLWKFFKKLDFNSIEIAICFFLLSFFIGHGSFHGFYWVVPSFFSFVVFLYFFSVINSEKTNWPILILASLIFPLIHGTGIFALSVLGFYSIIYSLFLSLPNFSWKKFIEKMQSNFSKKIVIIILLGFFSYFLVDFLLPVINYQVADDSIKIMSYSNIASGIGLEKSENFIISYLNKVLIHPVFLLFWLIIFGILLYYKKYRILSLYLATLIFSLVSSFLYYKGYRSLLYLWPITYILVGYSFCLIYKFIGNLSVFEKRLFGSTNIFNPLIRTILKITFIMVVAIFVLFNVVYSLWYINLKNEQMNIPYNSLMFDNLVKNYSTQDTALYFDKDFTISAFLYKNYEKNFNIFNPYWKFYKEDFNNSKFKKIVFVLEDDKIYNHNRRNSSDFYKNILKKFPIFSRLHLNGVSEERFSLDEKLRIFSLEDKKNHKIIYQDDNFYIFELIY